MKSKLLALLFLAGGTMFAGARVVVGVGVGVGYPPPPVYAFAPPPVYAYAPPPPPPVAYVPPVPGPGYTWVGGYWYPAGPRWAWRAGYWAHPPYAHSHWVAPRYYGHSYYGGYWHR